MFNSNCYQLTHSRSSHFFVENKEINFLCVSYSLTGMERLRTKERRIRETLNDSASANADY